MKSVGMPGLLADCGRRICRPALSPCKQQQRICFSPGQPQYVKDQGTIRRNYPHSPLSGGFGIEEAAPQRGSKLVLTGGLAQAVRYVSGSWGRVGACRADR